MTFPLTRRTAALAVAVALAASLLTACGDGDDSTGGTTSSSSTVTEAAGPMLEITGAWARTSPAVATAGAVYATIANVGDVDDALVDASVDAGIAASAELHETVAAGPEGAPSTAMGGPSDGGMMTMQPVERIPVPAGGSVALEPGGYHVMLLDLASPLVVSSTIEVTLIFEQAGERVVTVDVRDTAPQS